MAKVKTPRWGWALTGSGHFFKQCLRMVGELNDVDWNQLQVAEATHITALFAFFNRVANTFGLPSQHRLDLNPASTLEEDR